MATYVISNADELVDKSHDASVAPGDVLQLRGGNYNVSDLALRWIGKDDAHITLTNYPDEQVIFNPLTGYRIMLVSGEYIDISGNIILDAINVVAEGIKVTQDGANIGKGIILDGLEIKNAPMNGVLITNHRASATLSNLKIHNIGTNKGHHCIYVGDGTATIHDCECYSAFGHGIHIFSGSSKTKVYRNYCHNNKVGIGMYSFDAIIHDNICKANNESGIRVRYDAINAEIYNNTTLDNSETNLDVQTIGKSVFTADISNNVSLGSKYGVYIRTNNNNLVDGAIMLNNNSVHDATVKDIYIDPVDIRVVKEIL